MADLLIQAQVELFKYKNVANTTKVMSRMRSRAEQSKRFTYVNETPFQVIKTISNIPKYPLLFIYNCKFKPCARMMTTEAQVTVKNTGNSQISFNLDRRYYYPFGITIDPEKISRLPSGEEIELHISYTPTSDSQLGLQKFLIPIHLKSGAIGLLACECAVTVPTIRPNNLMSLCGHFSEFPVKNF